MANEHESERKPDGARQLRDVAIGCGGFVVFLGALGLIVAMNDDMGDRSGAPRYTPRPPSTAPAATAPTGCSPTRVERADALHRAAVRGGVGSALDRLEDDWAALQGREREDARALGSAFGTQQQTVAMLREYADVLACASTPSGRALGRRAGALRARIQ